MSGASYTITGMDRLQSHIKKLSNPKQTFDNDFQKAAQRGVRLLVEGTPKRFGNTRRGWTTPKKLGLSNYVVSNDISSGKWNIARILNDGRGEVTPKNGKCLYIPLSTRGVAKRAGQPIPKGFVFGEDYVLAKSSKAVEATNFIPKANKELGNKLVRDMISTIRRVSSGG